MQRPFVILSHVATHAVCEGFLPVAQRRGHPLLIVTDHAQGHWRHLADAGIAVDGLEILECDVFNPMAVIELLHAYFDNASGLREGAPVRLEPARELLERPPSEAADPERARREPLRAPLAAVRSRLTS